MCLQRSLVGVLLVAIAQFASACAFTTVGIPLLVEDKGERHPYCLYRIFPTAVDALLTAAAISDMAPPTPCTPTRPPNGFEPAPGCPLDIRFPELDVPFLITFGPSALFGLYEIGACIVEMATSPSNGVQVVP